MRKNLLLILIFSLVVTWAPNVYAEEILKLATTTSTDETGLLDYLLPDFETANNCKVHTISVGTGKALAHGRNGDVDVLLVHDPEAEQEFVDQGYGLKREFVMYNDFIILGPKSDPAHVKNTTDIEKVMKKIAQAKHTFVSRGDDSGTHRKEKDLWGQANVEPSGSWYLETGQGMSATLRIAEEKQAYVLVDRGTYLFNKDQLTLTVLVQGQSILQNHYGVIAINPEKHPHVNVELAQKFVKWITSKATKQKINDFRINGQKLFIAL